ncbi:MAG: hypothetical protein Q9219_005078 [cf. Caloplaca sp. 3 TL-2023]
MPVTPPSEKFVKKSKASTNEQTVEGSDKTSTPGKIVRTFHLNTSPGKRSDNVESIPQKIRKKEFSFDMPPKRNDDRDYPSGSEWLPPKPGKKSGPASWQRSPPAVRPRLTRSTKRIFPVLNPKYPSKGEMDGDRPGWSGDDSRSSSNKEVVTPSSGRSGLSSLPVSTMAFTEKIQPQDLSEIAGTGKLNDTTISVLLDHLIPPTSLVIDSLELDGTSEPVPSEQRKQAARAATQIIMPFHDTSREHWVLFLYTSETRSLELFDSCAGGNNGAEVRCSEVVRTLLSRLFGYTVDSPVTVQPCAQQTNGIDCGIHVVDNAYRLSHFQPVSLDPLNTVALRQEYHRTLLSLSAADADVNRITTSATATHPDPANSPPSDIHMPDEPTDGVPPSNRDDSPQAKIRAFAFATYNKLSAELLTARNELAAVVTTQTALSQKTQHACSDLAIAEGTLASFVAGREKLSGGGSKSGREFADHRVLPYLSQWVYISEEWKKTCEAELKAAMNRKEGPEEENRLAKEVERKGTQLAELKEYLKQL